jgi:hypothetical protein
MKNLLMAASAAFFMACTNKQNSVETADCSLPVANSYLQDSYAEVPLDQYLRIKDALVSSNPYEAQKAARHLDSLWTIASPGEQLLSAVRQIAATNDLAEQRKAFYTLTQAYLVALEQQPQEDSLYLQFCPMAFDYEGATWISREKTVMNPYFGDEMLNCGVVRKAMAPSPN